MSVEARPSEMSSLEVFCQIITLSRSVGVRSSVIGVILASLTLPVWAGQSAESTRTNAVAAFEAGNFGKCATLFVQAANESLSMRGAFLYEAARCHALNGKKNSARSSLSLAVLSGSVDPGILLRDDAFLTLRSMPSWKVLMQEARTAYLKGRNLELYELYASDQEERSDPSRIDWALLGERDEVRRRRVDELLDGGVALSAQDLYWASMVHQHGGTQVDSERAHELAMQALAIDRYHGDALWLAAATADRVLWFAGKPQKFGTQIVRKEGKYEVYDVDPSVTDEERARWNVPTLAEARKRAERKNKK